MELRRNVVLTSDDGMRLETSVLRWKGAERRLWTDAPVRLYQDGARVEGQRPGRSNGRRGDGRSGPGAGDVHRRAWAVTARIVAAGLLAAAVVGNGMTEAQTVPNPAKNHQDRQQPVTVDADRMERLGKESLVIFIGNVVARQNGSVQYADRVELYLDEKGDRILRSVSTGNVRIITKDCKTGTAKRVEYFDLDQRVVLSGDARVWQEDNVVTGETITIFLAQDRSVVHGGKQERVKAVFHPKDEREPATKTAAAPRVTCEP